MSRILWMLNVLLSRGRLTRLMAQRELGIQHRSFFRYIGTLRDAGFMIDADQEGAYRLRIMSPEDRAERICTGPYREERAQRWHLQRYLPETSFRLDGGTARGASHKTITRRARAPRVKAKAQAAA
ncbi:MAG TPA: hypothetical protein VNF68_12840 [Candidatus Baltobacteraceae bacterium]|nr:hypothetical protein [Candidatus Baltobacteraceae bacterium]